MFLKGASKIHRKLQGLLWERGDAGQGRRQGRRALVTFGNHRRPPARTRARGRRPDLRATAHAADPRMCHYVRGRTHTAWPVHALFICHGVGTSGSSSGEVEHFARTKAEENSGLTVILLGVTQIASRIP